MHLSCSQVTLLAALVTIARATIMVKTVDGSFTLLRRAPVYNGTVAVLLKNENDLAYAATVLMGTPQQQVQMSASLSQNYISVASTQDASNASYYNPSASASYVPRNETASVQTISGTTVTGRFADEKCWLKSATSSLSFAYNASVLLTDASVVADLYPASARGILGYGVKAPANSPPGASLIGSFLPENFTNAICGIELNHMNDPFPDGILTMGAVDTSAYTGEFTNVTVPSNSQVSWSIPFDNFTFQAEGSPQTLQGLVASIDPYYTGIRLPTDMVSQIYSGINGSQPISSTVYSVSCASKFSVTLTFGGTPFTISERDTIVRLSNGTCHGAIMGGAQEVAQVGAPFLRNVYTQFGAQKATDGSVTFAVGFATKNVRQNAPSTTSTSGTPRVIVRNLDLCWTLAVASIVAIFFL